MHKILSALLVSQLALTVCAAQGFDSSSSAVIKNEFYFKVNPLAILEPDGGIGLSAEYILAKPRLGFQVEVQPIVVNLTKAITRNGWEPPIYTSHTGNPLGIEIRPEVRKYLTAIKPFQEDEPSGTHRSSKARTYLALDFLYKKTWRQRTSDVSIASSSGAIHSERNTTYTDIKTVWGADLKFGAVMPVSGNGSRWIEFFIGAGFRSKQFSYSHLPDGTLPPERKDLVQPTFLLGFLTSDSEFGHDLHSTRVSVPMGFKFVYRL